MSASSTGEIGRWASSAASRAVVGHGSMPAARVERADQRLARRPAADVVGDPGRQQGTAISGVLAVWG